MSKPSYKNGAVFGKWVLHQYINAGGNGEVWSAKEENNETNIVAIKIGDVSRLFTLCYSGTAKKDYAGAQDDFLRGVPPPNQTAKCLCICFLDQNPDRLSHPLSMPRCHFYVKLIMGQYTSNSGVHEKTPAYCLRSAKIQKNVRSGILILTKKDGIYTTNNIDEEYII